MQEGEVERAIDDDTKSALRELGRLLRDEVRELRAAIEDLVSRIAALEAES